MLNFVIFTVSVRNSLDTPLYQHPLTPLLTLAIRSRGYVRTVQITEMILIVRLQFLLLGLVGFIQRVFVKQFAISRKLFVIIVGLRSSRTEIYHKPETRLFYSAFGKSLCTYKRCS
jgi:hypothetical protein